LISCTGLVGRGELAACVPDALLDSFENHEAALRAIFP
jgi:hypothetical protein